MAHAHACVPPFFRYAPDGSLYATVDAGGKIYIYDGKEGTFKNELNGGEPKAHAGGIYGLSWCAIKIESARAFTENIKKSLGPPRAHATVWGIAR